MYRQSPQMLRPKTESHATKKSGNYIAFQRTFKVNYLGYAVLDRRYTLAMLPWLVAEIKRHGSRNEETISIVVTDKSLKANSCASDSLVFEHRLQTISKFAQTSQDPTCFTYMTREVETGPCAYHVFQAQDENSVLELFTIIRKRSKELLNQLQNVPLIGAKGTSLESILSSCQQYEVLYVGRIKAPGKRAHSSFIDETVVKFKIHEQERDKNSFCKRTRHGSGASVQSLPHNLETLKNVNESFHKDASNNELDTSSRPSSCEGISQNSLVSKINCDTDPAFSSHQSLHTSLDYSLDSFSQIQSLVPHSQSMDIGSTCQMLNEFKNFDIKNYLVPPSTIIPHTQSLDTSASEDIVQDLRDFNSSLLLRDRVRSCSGDIPRSKQTSFIHYQHNSESGIDDVGRPRAYTSPTTSDYRPTNRTMLFLIGCVDISLISTDKKQFLLRKQFDAISYCAKGVKYLDYFGLVCRETTKSGADSYAAYIFRCQNDRTVEELMNTLKLSFAKALQTYQKYSLNTSLVPKTVTCELCPMQWFHELCSDVEGLSAEDTHLIILKRLRAIANIEKEKIIVKFQKVSANGNVQEQNEVLMMLIREFCEQKQLSHNHIPSKKNGKSNNDYMKEKGSKLDSLREKAKKSISNSFETILKLTNREDLKESVAFTHQAQLDTQKKEKCDSHLAMCKIGCQFVLKVAEPDVWTEKDFDTRSYREGSCDNTYFSEHTSPRPRSSTFSSPREVHYSSKKGQQNSQKKTPIINMFFKAENPNARSSFIQSEAKGSWRQAIFHRVQSQDYGSKEEVSHSIIQLPKTEQIKQLKKTKQEIKALWKKAINEQIILIRMEKENKNLQVNQDAACHKRMKLDYEEVTPCIKTVTEHWEQILSHPDQTKFHKEKSTLIEAVKKGVPRHKRGEIWQYLAQQNRSWNKKTEFDDLSTSYEELLKQLTSHQHAILIDIGRTFPNHAFFSQHLGAGQLSLFNLLKAYSLFDQEVGYCQGISFVAGILLLHMPEEEAFFMLQYLMYDLGIRKQYKTDMVALQVQMYQLSRLLHDNFKDLYDHLVKFDINPTLYAAPWFLTLFASQFPVGFVARLFDLLFLFGMDVIFKVSLLLLGKSRYHILSCDSFETVMDFLKNALPSIDLLEMQIIFNEVFNLDISCQLHSFEVEYKVLLEEMAHSPTKNSEEIETLRIINKQVKSQNIELTEKLQLSSSHIHCLENSQMSLKSTIRKLEARISVLEDEKEALMHSMFIMKMRLERLEGKEFVDFEEKFEHPPPIRIVYSGTEKEENESFKALVKELCSRKDKETSDFKFVIESLLPDDIAEENVFEDPS